jgi:hypothetical protein
VSSLWRVFIDDSADGKKQSHVLAGALIGRKAGWHDFEKKWYKALRASPRIKYFHQKEFVGSNGEFLKFRDQECWPRPAGKNAMHEKLERLRKIITEASIVALGITVTIPDYERVRASHARAKYFMSSDAFDWALQNVIFQSVKAIRRVDESARIAFISDSSYNAARYADIYASFKRRNPMAAQSMLGISHFDDKEWPGLQAADMIAATTKTVVDHHNKTGEINTEVPMFDKFFMVGNVNEAYLLDVLNDQTISNEELERFEKVNRKTRERTKFDNAMDNLLKANPKVVEGDFTA